MKTIMHSYTFRAYPLEEAFRNAARFGWEGIELQPCHFDRQDVVNGTAPLRSRGTGIRRAH